MASSPWGRWDYYIKQFFSENEDIPLGFQWFLPRLPIKNVGISLGFQWFLKNLRQQHEASRLAKPLFFQWFFNGFLQQSQNDIIFLSKCLYFISFSMVLVEVSNQKCWYFIGFSMVCEEPDAEWAACNPRAPGGRGPLIYNRNCVEALKPRAILALLENN